MSSPACPNDEALRSLLDGRLTGAAEDECREHLDGCPACRDRLEGLAGGCRWVPPESALASAAKLSARALEAVRAARPAADGDAGGVPGSSFEAEAAAEVLALLEPAATPGGLGRLGDHEVVRVLGHGGMGVVLEARDTHLERRVAIKVLAPVLAVADAFRQRFAREARAAAAVRHPNVITVHAVREGPKRLPYIVMEFVDGESLEERLDREGRLAPDEVAALGRDVARGLAAAHAAGLVHRDIKPSNILLDAVDGRAKIADFGIARDPSDAALTATGQLIGTPHFMSPEQAEGRAVDARADLFSLGAVLYAASTGRRPFEGGTAVAVLKSVTESTPLAPHIVDRGIPRWLSDAIRRLLAKSPHDRFASADEVVKVLETGPGQPAPAWKRLPARLPAILFACAIAGVSVWLGGEGPPRDDAPRGSPSSDQAATDSVASWPDGSSPFVIVERDGRELAKAGSLRDAIAGSPAGATIEIRDDGPFTLEPVLLRRKPIRIRAAPGHRPALVAESGWRALFLTDTTIVLEGLDIHDAIMRGDQAPSARVDWDLDPDRTLNSFVGVYEGEVLASHCRFRCTGSARQLVALVRSRCTLRNCELYGRSAAVLIDQAGEGDSAHSVVSLENTALAAGLIFKLTRLSHEKNDVRVDRSTLRFGPLFVVHRGLRAPSVRVTDSILGMQSLLHVIAEPGRNVAPATHLRWSGRGNIYDLEWFAGEGLLPTRSERILAQSHDEWRRIWGESDLDAQLCGVRFRHSLFGSWNSALEPTPELSGVIGLASSDGQPLDPSHAAGKGMDPQLVGPGRPYHRWRASEGYEAWEAVVREALDR